MTVSIAAVRIRNKHGGAAARLNYARQGGGNAVLAQRLAAMGEPKRASTGRAVQEHYAQAHPRYRIGDGQGNYLSRDGQGVVNCVRESWWGDAVQVSNALMRFSAAKGMRALRSLETKLPSLAGQFVI
jgi:hypothetical protein